MLRIVIKKGNKIFSVHKKVTKGKKVTANNEKYGKDGHHRMWSSQRKSSATSFANDNQVKEHEHPMGIAIKAFAVALTAATCHFAI